jgi:putative endonuclease
MDSSAPDSPTAYPPHRLGARGEQIAADRLEQAGWHILARGYRLGRREVDLVVRRREVLAFVEVKTRSGYGYGPPEEAVTYRKRSEIEAVARDYLMRHSDGVTDVRFDVVAIEIGKHSEIVRYEHIEDAWRPSAP